MNALSSIWNGKAGLAKTYWGYGILGSVIWGLVLSVLPQGEPITIAAVLVFCAYLMAVNICVWRAASRCEGASTWAALAKVMAAVAIAIIVTVLAMVVAAIQRGDVPA